MLLDELLFTGEMRPPAMNGDVGYDIPVAESRYLPPNSFHRVLLAARVAIPDGYWGLLTARSSTNYQGQLLVLPGVVDCGYRGPLYAFVHNLSELGVDIEAGSRICQLVLIPRAVLPMRGVQRLPDSERGENGMGSTGA